VGAAIALAGAYYWNVNYWSTRTCEDVKNLAKYYDPTEASVAERAAAGYALLSIRQFECGENTEFERRRAEKAISEH
jgi:hypothetical protein